MQMMDSRLAGWSAGSQSASQYSTMIIIIVVVGRHSCGCERLFRIQPVALQLVLAGQTE